MKIKRTCLFTFTSYIVTVPLKSKKLWIMFFDELIFQLSCADEVCTNYIVPVCTYK